MRIFTVKRVFVAVIPLLIIAVLAAYFTIGLLLQKNYQKLLNEAKPAKKWLQLKVVSFDRGWFSSTATVKATITLPSTTPAANHRLTQSASFLLKQYIQQGPFIFTTGRDNQTKFLFGKALIHTKINKKDFTKETTTFIHWNNDIDINEHIKHLSLKHDNLRYSLSNVSSSINYNADPEKMNGTFSVGSLKVLKKNMPPSLMIDNLHVDFDLTKKNKYWYGTHTSSIDSINIKKPRQLPTKINGIELKTKTERHKKSTSTQIDAQINQVLSNNLVISPITASLKITGLNSVALDNCLDTLRELVESRRLVSWSTLYEPTMKVLAHGATFSLSNVLVGTNQGSLKANGNLTFLKKSNAPQSLMLVEDTMGSLSIVFPKALLQDMLTAYYTHQRKLTSKSDDNGDNNNNGLPKTSELAAQKIALWIQNKLLIQNEQKLKLSVQYQKGQLLINGQQKSFGDISSEIKSMPTSNSDATEQVAP